MGKYSKYEKKYNQEWEKEAIFRGWLKRGILDPDKAHCTVCRTDLRAQRADLVKHSKTKTHMDKAVLAGKSTNAGTSKQNVLTAVGITSSSSVTRIQKTIDLQLTAFVATHTSIKAVDHLGELLRTTGSSPLENLRLHRTKCTKLIQRVLSPAILDEIINDINSSDGYYSLIVDESTDVSVNKYLCICLRYFSKTKTKMVTEYLGLVNVVRTCAEDLYEAIKLFLKKNNLNISRLLGIATDGANNLCGKYKSLFTLLKKDVPNLQIIKCVCHSLHLCAEAAAKDLPASVDYLLRETYNWFHISAIRRYEYKNIYDLINTGEEKTRHNIVQLSTTRWLSRYKSIHVILEQWLELQTHFSMFNKNEKCHTSRTLEEMYKDDAIYLYLTFLRPVLKDLQMVNLFFQHTNADFYKAFESLFSLILNICGRILKPLFMYHDVSDVNVRIAKLKKALDNDLAFLHVESVDFGLIFSEKLEANKSLSSQHKENMQIKCFNFLKTLARKLVDKLPDNLHVLQTLKNLSPLVCLNLVRPSLNSFPLELKETGVKLDDLESDWRNLVTVNWKDLFGLEIPSDPVEFWSYVNTYKNAGGQPMFKYLPEFALKLLSLPLSNSVVERVFSVMNIVKYKLRNSMKLETLDAILRIRIYFSNHQMCCQNFKPTERMYQLFNYDIYKDSITKDDKLENDMNEIIEIINDVF